MRTAELFAPLQQTKRQKDRVREILYSPSNSTRSKKKLSIAQIFLSCQTLEKYCPLLWRKGRVYMEHIHQFCLHPIFIPPPTFAYEQHLYFNVQITGLNFSQPYSSDWQIGVLICVINIYSMLSVLYKKMYDRHMIHWFAAEILIAFYISLLIQIQCAAHIYDILQYDNICFLLRLTNLDENCGIFTPIFCKNKVCTMCNRYIIHWSTAEIFNWVHTVLYNNILSPSFAYKFIVPRLTPTTQMLMDVRGNYPAIVSLSLQHSPNMNAMDRDDHPRHRLQRGLRQQGGLRFSSSLLPGPTSIYRYIFLSTLCLQFEK